MCNKWKELCAVKETRRHEVSVEWNKSMDNNDVINNTSILVEKDTKDETNKEATTTTSSSVTPKETSVIETPKPKKVDAMESNEVESVDSLAKCNEEGADNVMQIQSSSGNDNSNEAKYVKSLDMIDAAFPVQEINDFMNDVLQNSDASDEDDLNTHLQRDARGVLPLTFCHFCNSTQTTHYCLFPCKDSHVIDSENNIKICGKAMCINCRSSWGEAEDYVNRCVDHKVKSMSSDSSGKKANSKGQKVEKRKQSTSNSGRTKAGNQQTTVGKTFKSPYNPRKTRCSKDLDRRRLRKAKINNSKK